MKPELIVQIPPLRPTGPYDVLQAQIRQGDMLAAINLRPHGSNTYIFEQYWDRTNRKIRRKLTSGQDERGLALLQLLRERLTLALEASGWQSAGVNYEGRSLWRYAGPATSEQPSAPSAGIATQKPALSSLLTRPQRRSKRANTPAPVPPAPLTETPTFALTPPQPDQVQPVSKRVEVPGATKPRAAFRRTIHTRLVTFTCEQCGTTVSQQRFPGPHPRYCTEACKQEAMRVGTLARVHRFRAKQRVGGESAP